MLEGIVQGVVVNASSEIKAKEDLQPGWELAEGVIEELGSRRR